MTVETYIEAAPAEVRDTLRAIRNVIRQAAPEAEEKIGWGMPAYYLKGPLVFFAAQKKHVGFYPTPAAIEAFRDRLADYKTTKGGVQFPYDRPVPYDLIAEMVKFRVAETRSKKMI